MDQRFSIVTKNLTKQYGGETAVNELSLQIQSGAVYGFLGLNGAGKTTTIRMLTALLEPTSGTATIAGESIQNHDTITNHLGYLPESPPVHTELSAREQLSYAAGLQDIPTATAEERIDSFLAQFGLTEDADRRIGSYSKGMRQKVGLIQAVLHNPAVVILDEPTSGLDPRSARSVKDLIEDLSDNETTVFLSTHILPVVSELADTVGILADGELVAEGRPEVLTERAEGGETTLEEVFLELTSNFERPHSQEYV